MTEGFPIDFDLMHASCITHYASQLKTLRRYYWSRNRTQVPQAGTNSAATARITQRAACSANHASRYHDSF